MKKIVVTTLAVLLLQVASSADGQEFWLKKPYQEWSAEETARMMHDSPWAITTTLRSASNPSAQISSPTGPALVGGYESNGQLDPSVVYTLRLCSAAPIRQAMVRSGQLRSHYDSMSQEQRAAFDAGANKFLAVTFPDRIEVCVTFKSNVDNYQSRLRAYWNSQTAPKLNSTVFLDAGKDRMQLQAYACKDETFQFTFPRPKQVTAETPLAIEFTHPTVDVVFSQNLHLSFKPKKMLVNGEPVL